MPTAVELIASLGAVVIPLPAITVPDDWMSPMASNTTNIGGRSSIVGQTRSAMSPVDLASGLTTGKRQHSPFVATTNRDAASGLPSGKRQHSPLTAADVNLPQVRTALQKVLPNGQTMVEAIGVGTDLETLHDLVGLLRTQGYHATITYLDSSKRAGFAQPTAILRPHGGVVWGVFLQKVAAALRNVTAQDDWEAQT